MTPQKINPMPIEAGQLPWTNDGKLLLITFQRLVKEYGGHFVLWSKMRREVTPPKVYVRKRKFIKSAWMHRYAAFVLANYKIMSTKQMAAYCGCSTSVIQHICTGLRLNRAQSFMGASYPSMNRYYYDIIDLETGIFYDNAKQVAFAICRPAKTVQGWISKARGKSKPQRFVKL